MMNENKIGVLNKQGDGKNIKYTMAYSIHKQLYKLHPGEPRPHETHTHTHSQAMVKTNAYIHKRIQRIFNTKYTMNK